MTIVALPASIVAGSVSADLDVPSGARRAAQRVGEPQVLLLVAYLLWRAGLDVAYVWFMHPANDHLGFGYAPDALRAIESYVWLIIMVLLAPAQTRRPSAFLLHILLAILAVPTLVYYVWSGDEARHFYVLLTGILTLLALTRALPTIVAGGRLRGGKMLSLSFCVAIVAGAVGSIAMRGGLASLNFDFSRVYEFRSDTTLRLYTGAWAYLYSWAGGALNPLLMAYAFHRRSLTLAALALGAQVFLFAATSNKIFIFLPVVVFGCYAATRIRFPIATVLFALVIFVVGIPMILYAFDLGIVADLLLRRTVFMPTFLNFTYVDFFETHDLVFRSNSLLAFASDYPYGATGTGDVIGNYLGMREGNAVTGYLGSAYMHFGLAGVLTASAVMAGILKVLDGLCVTGLQASFVIAAAVAAVRTAMVEADMVTSLVTHGLAIALLALLALAADPHNSER